MLSPIEILKIKLENYPRMYEKLSSITIALAIDQAEQAILTYCNRTKLPQGLFYVCADIARDLLIYEYQSGRAVDDPEVLTAGETKKIKVGRVEITNSKSASDFEVKTLSEILDLYVDSLNAYRLLVW